MEFFPLHHQSLIQSWQEPSYRGHPEHSGLGAWSLFLWQSPGSNSLTSYFNSELAGALVLSSVIDCVFNLVVSFWKIRAWREAF